MNMRVIATGRIPAVLAILALAATLLIACGPADESVQQRIGNLPVAEPPVAPQSEPDPTKEKPTTVTPTEEPTLEPTPVPTTCLNYPPEEGEGPPIIRCFTFPPITPQYPNVLSGILEDEIENYERDRDGRRRSN